jgi:hypothetical protein
MLYGFENLQRNHCVRLESALGFRPALGSRFPPPRFSTMWPSHHQKAQAILHADHTIQVARFAQDSVLGNKQQQQQHGDWRNILIIQLLVVFRLQLRY